MAAVAKNPAFAKKVGIKQSVGEEFMKADKGRKFGKGGMTKHDDIAEDKKLIKKAFGMHDKQEHPGKKTNLTKLKGGGMAKETMGPRTMKMDVEKGSNKLLKHGESAVQKRGHTKGTEERGFKTLGIQAGAKGGSKKTVGAAPIKMARGGGIESKGKTKGRFVTMCGGGKAGKK